VLLNDHGYPGDTAYLTIFSAKKLVTDYLMEQGMGRPAGASRVNPWSQGAQSLAKWK
jgi:hypothetical protein